MKALLAIATQTFLLLRRDKVFVPLLILGFLIFAFANLASEWGVEEFEKILFDVSFAGFNFTGVIVTIFWGAKLVSDARRDGSIEVQLAAPIQRGVWIVGRYLGLVFTLSLVAVVLVALCQMLMLNNRFGWLREKQLIVFALLTLGWFVIGALTMFLSSFAGQATAMFSCLCLWIVGVTSQNIMSALPARASMSSKMVFEFLSTVWDLGRFNLSDAALSMDFPDPVDLYYRLGYGAALIALFMMAAVWVFKTKDVMAQ